MWLEWQGENLQPGACSDVQMLRCTDVKEVGGGGGAGSGCVLDGSLAFQLEVRAESCVLSACVCVCVCVGLVALQCAREKASSEGFLSEVWLFSLSIPAIPP